MAGKIDAIAVVEADLSAHKLDSIGMLNESSITNFTASDCETRNGEENHNEVSCLTVLSTPADISKKIEVEDGSQSCSSQPCLETLERSPVDDLSIHEPPDRIGVLEESSIPDFTVSGSGCEKQNGEENGNDANGHPVASAPTDTSKRIEGEDGIQSCSSQPCLKTSERSPVDDLSIHEPPDSTGVLEESSVPDYTVSDSGCEKQNGEKNGNDASGLPFASAPTDTLKKIEGEHSLRPCSSQPCLETLERSPVDDLSAHKPADSIEVLGDSSIPDFTVSGSGCEKQNGEVNGNDANCLPVASGPIDTSKECLGEHCIQLCSSQPSLEALESSPVDDSSTHKPPESIGVLEESLIPDYTVAGSGFEKLNCEDSGNDANSLPVVSAPTDTLEKSEGVQPCSLQPSPETRESSPLDDSSIHKSPNRIGMPEELSIIDVTLSNSQVQIGEGNHCEINCLPVVSAFTDISKESEVENGIQPCSSQPCLERLENSPLDGSLCNFIQENERMEDKSSSNLFEEGVLGVVEEESDVTTEIKDGTLDQKLCVEGDEYRVKEDSSEISPKSLESCCPVDITENRSSGKLDALGPQNVVFGGVSPCPAAELYEQKDKEGRDLAGNNNPIVLLNSSPLISCMSSPVHESSHKTKPKQASRKSKNKAKVQDLHIFFGEWKRRSRSSKPARSSNWGWLGNIEKYFEHNNRLGLNEIQNYETGRKNPGQGSRKRNKSRANGSNQGSREKKNTSTGGIRLKVKVGKEVCKSIAISDAFDTSAFGGVGHFGTKSQAGISSEAPSYASGFGDKIGADRIAKQLQCFDNKLRDETSQSDPSFLDLHLADKDLEGAGHAGGDCLGLPSHTRVQGSEAVIQKSYTDPGTSPDSEVINLVPDSQASSRSPENLSDTVSPSKVFAPAAISDGKRGNTKDIVSDVGDCFAGDIFCQTARANKSKTKKQQRSKKSRDDGAFYGKAGNKNGCKKRGKERKSVNQKKVEEKTLSRDNQCEKGEDDTKAGSCVLDDIGKSIFSSNAAAIEAPSLDLALNNTAEQHIPVDNAWVRCDDCHKWRRIPVALVDSIGQTNCQWTCKDNADKDYADCSIAQEKSNEEINAELGISDADEDAYDAPPKSKGLELRRPSFISNEHEFTLISSNQFLHRSRKTQTIDEIMVCHCKLPLDGRLGCGDECLNRMLNIECVQGTCPCGDLCSNQQFQKRNYAKMKWERFGKKGFGLRSEEDIPKGHFLIEYVGEVLDMHTYEARQREYAFNSHKHFYFMTLNGSEVIDACAKGNLGRFINHSCDPNCRTEKWVVNGEICIGLFALRDIKKGEEVTFDYNYVRVFGAAAKKCYCGSSNCRGYIGGDPTSTEVIDQVDSDEEFLEPVMLEDGKAKPSFKNRKPRSSSLNDEPVISHSFAEDKNKMDHPEVHELKLEFASEIQDAVDQSKSAESQLINPSLEYDDLKAKSLSYCPAVEISESSSDVMFKSVAANQEISMEYQRSETSISDGSATKLKSKSSIVEEKRVFVKSRFLLKNSSESSSSKKGKVASNHLNASRLPMLPNKSQMLSIKQKKFMHGTSNGRLETVEEKLNELLDTEGGISKRKDAAKGYLKFLVHTATSGASGNGEAIQSNRDLSMILDALLKTKSKVVLVDIINKNGLRMLHNMIKQYRKDFKKTPILRKLLKVIEHLKAKEILTQEHINGGPPCPGMESFRDSMLSLCEHDDKQVHQIARNFRDKWIPRHGRRHGNMVRDRDRDDRKMDYHKNSNSSRIQNHTADVVSRPPEATDCSPQSKPPTSSVDPASSEASGGTKRRKRKSRWDQPALPKPEKETRESYCPHCALNYGQQHETSSADSAANNMQTDVPPGFSPMASSTVPNPSDHNGGLKFPDGMVVGYQQKKFDSHYPVSYGIPLPVMHEFELLQDGTNWTVAPGVPFHPFPPLPPFPLSQNPPVNSNGEAAENQHNNPSSSCSNHRDEETPVEDEQHSAKRARASQDLGKRYFRQQKWNKVPPPWIRGRNVTYEPRNSFYSQASSCESQQNSNLN